jgi:transposase
MSLFVGLDWAKDKHAVCVIDQDGRVRSRLEVPHTAAGLEDLLVQLRRLARASELPIAIERPSGVLVDTLMAAGHPVIAIHPNVVKACRPRYKAAAGKSDPGDAYLLADVLRTDGHRFTPLRPFSDETRALRALVRTRDDLVAQRVALANQLRALLESFWAGAEAIFADIDSPIALAFLAQYPTPTHASRLGEKRLAAFLARHAYCGRRPANELLQRLRNAPASTADELETEAKGETVRALVNVLEPLVLQVQKLSAAVEHAITTHADAATLTSFPRIGRINAAQILSELGDDRGRFSCEEHLAAEAGVAPVTVASGKHRSVTFRWACNKRLRGAITCWADNSRHSSAWAASVYTAARTRGCDHPHAVRVLARAWIRVLWRCWHDRQPYNPVLHGAMNRLAPTARTAGA